MSRLLSERSTLVAPTPGASSRYAAKEFPNRAFRPARLPVSKMLLNLGNSGHGATFFGPGATSNLNDTSDFTLGTQAASWTTSGTAYGFVQKATIPATNITGKILRLWVKIDTYATLNQLILYVGSDAGFTNTASQQIAWGSTRQTQSPIRSAGWQTIDVPVTDLTTVTGTPDLTNIVLIRVYGSDNGTGPLTMHVGGVALVDPSVSRFPTGLISLTFDDGYSSHYAIARPKMDTYGYAGTAYPITGNIGGASQCTVAQLQDLQANHGWEFGAHASTDATHTAGQQGQTVAALRTEFETVLGWLHDNGLRADSHAWPNGDSDTNAETVAADYFRVSRGVFSGGANGVNREVYPPSQPYRVRAINAGTITLAQMQAAAAKAASGAWVIFIFHNILTTKSGTNDVATSDFNSLIDYIATLNVPVHSIGRALTPP